jgi:hypothetical protein
MKLQRRVKGYHFNGIIHVTGPAISELERNELTELITRSQRTAVVVSDPAYDIKFIPFRSPKRLRFLNRFKSKILKTQE